MTRAESQVQVPVQPVANETPIPASSEPKNLYDILFGRLTAGFAFAALTASFFLPEDGLGIDICWIRHLLKLPCPGCGLTRSITCISHLHIAKSWAYHPFGLLFYCLFAANILLAVSPQKFRRNLRETLSRHGTKSRAAYRVFITCFVVFGVARMVWLFVVTGPGRA